MMCGRFFIIFGLSCLLFPCEGQIIPPPGGNRLTFSNESIAKIEWSLDGNLSTTSISIRSWSFRSSSVGKEELLARIIDDDQPAIVTKLYEIDIEKPATLVLKNVNESYDGTYEFSLISSGTRTSEVVVFIAVRPIVTVSCASIITVNQTDNFTCECNGTDGNPPADVTWYKDNRRQNVTGKERAILRLSNVSKDDNGTYRCEAKSHERAKNETTIELYVNYPPTIIRFHFNYTSRTLTCEVEGQPPPSIQIFFNGTDLIPNGNTYTIPKVNSSYVGTYECLAKNILGNDMMPTSILPIATPIITVNCSSLTTVNQGDYFACKCKGTDGNPPAAVTWYKDNTQINTGKEEAILRFPRVYQVDNSTYICEAKSLEEAKNETLIELIVPVTPIVTVSCSSTTIVNQGYNFSCECKGTGGNPPADVIWYKNNTEIVTGKEKAILRLTNVSKDDSGTYRCEAKSSEKAKNITEIQLIIIVKPILTVNCANTVELEEGEDFTCECSGTGGNPPANVTWYKGTTQIAGPEKEHATLVLKNVKKDDSGTYKCVAKSDDNAKAEKNIKIVVIVPCDDVICIVAIIIGVLLIIALAIYYYISRKHPLDTKWFVAMFLIGVSTSLGIIAAGAYYLTRESTDQCVTCIIAIIIGVSDLIFAVVVYFSIKSRSRNKYKENANVSPSSTGAVNHYELDENEESPVEINTHEALNTSGTSATTNNAPENTSANDNNKEIKSMYPTLNFAIIETGSDNSIKQDGECPQPTEDADTDMASTEQVP